MGITFLDIYKDSDEFHFAFLGLYWRNQHGDYINPSLFNYQTGIEDKPYTNKLWILFVPFTW